MLNLIKIQYLRHGDDTEFIFEFDNWPPWRYDPFWVITPWRCFRIFTVVGASMSGEKLPLLVIGKSLSPYCLRRNSVPDDTFYRSQSSSWMDAAIFKEYLNKLDTRFQKSNKNVIIFIDICRAHPTETCLQHLINIKIYFFSS